MLGADRQRGRERERRKRLSYELITIYLLLLYYNIKIIIIILCEDIFIVASPHRRFTLFPRRWVFPWKWNVPLLFDAVMCTYSAASKVLLCMKYDISKYYNSIESSQLSVLLHIIHIYFWCYMYVTLYRRIIDLFTYVIYIFYIILNIYIYIIL